MIGEPTESSLEAAEKISSDFVFEAGAGGGLVASIATCPLDVVKTKLQAQRTVQGQRGHLGILGE